MFTARIRWFPAFMAVLLLVLTASPSQAGGRRNRKGDTDKKQVKKEPAGAEKTADDKVAVVNGTVISRVDFDREMIRALKTFRQRRPDAEPDRDKMRKTVLGNLMDLELLYQEGVKKGIKIGKKEIDKELEDIKKGFANGAEFKKALENLKTTEAAIKKQIKRMKTIDRYIQEEFVKKAQVSEKEAREYYTSKQGSFKTPGKLRTRHILVEVAPNASGAERAAALEKIKGIQKRLQAGEDFVVLAKMFSDGPSSPKGGDLGLRVRGAMVKPFDDASFALKRDEVSGIVETRFGYHLIKALERTPERVIPFEDVESKLIGYLTEKKAKAEIAVHTKKLRDAAEIEEFLPKN